MYLYDNVDNITVKLRKSYYSLYNYVRFSENLIVNMLYIGYYK